MAYAKQLKIGTEYYDLDAEKFDGHTYTEVNNRSKKCVATTPSFTSLPQTFTDNQLTFEGSVNHITTDMIAGPYDYIASNPSAMGNDWSISTATAGRITISGTFNGSTGTTLKLFFSYE